MNQQNTHLISAIMIVYNGDRFIAAAIDSILGQSYSNFELLILNDGSNDKTEEIALSKAAVDKRIRYFKNEGNKGLGYSRNRIIKETRGDYIVVTDADDMSLPSRFEKQLNFLITNPGIQIYGSSVILMDGEGKTYDKWDYDTDDKKIREGFRDACAVANPSAMFSKNVFLRTGDYNESLAICEDWEFFYRAAEHFNFGNSEEALINYRVHNSNVSKNKLEPTVVFSVCLNNKLDRNCLSFNINKIAEVYPDLKDELARKIIKFYTFWMGTYNKLGYYELSADLYSYVTGQLFPVFDGKKKKLFEKSAIVIFARPLNFRMLAIAFKDYLLK